MTAEQIKIGFSHEEVERISAINNLTRNLLAQHEQMDIVLKGAREAGASIIDSIRALRRCGYPLADAHQIVAQSPVWSDRSRRRK